MTINIPSQSRSKFDTDVINETSAKIRSFLYELAEGTSNYKSLHNLTEQVEHQYHGRFLIELVQNAHDALNEEPTPDEPSRIETALIPDEGPHGTLYVANDGRPFSESNFKSLSQLGQSDKDPQASIGNKGIGFRSVLEITRSPEIYSRSSAEKPVFDGYCFGFSPSIIDKFCGPIVSLFNGEDRVMSPLDDSTFLVGEWGSELLQKFRSNLKSKGATWLANELKYLSPYLLPFPIALGSSDHSVLGDYEQRGFVTVIRFPLKSDVSRELAIAKIEEMEAKSILFLERATSLVLDSGRMRRELRRKISRVLPGNHHGYEVTIQDSHKETPSKYWLWSEPIEVARASEEFQQAVKQLPGKWPELKEAVVMLAVGVTQAPEKGTFSIFLPTEMSTGCGAYINASFYGDMSRTDVDFEKTYNRLLLSSASEMALDVVLSDLAGRGVEEARAIVDILAPWPGKESAGIRWFGLLNEVAATRDLALQKAKVFLSDKGWDALEDTSFIPNVEAPSIMKEQTLRRHASFPAFVPEMTSRKDLLESLFDAVRVEMYPSEDDMAFTIESLAAEIHQNDEKTDWNGFWADAIKLFKKDSTPLKGKRILRGTDNNLHASGEECSVFFIPRRGGFEDEEMLNESAVHEIPVELKDHVAFLHQDIQVYDENDARVRTEIHKFLDTNLVQRFRVEDILTSVLIPRTPKLPIPFQNRERSLCADIMLWGLRLVSGLAERGIGERTIKLLHSLPVPCEGGWYALGECTFGPGWPDTFGNYTRDYLAGAATDDCKEAINRILLPPHDELWGENGTNYQSLLARAGVFDGLRLINLGPTDWQAKFITSRDSFQLPPGPPPGISQDIWDTYRSYVKANIIPQLNYGGVFYYQLQTLNTIPGIDKYTDFSESTRLSFMNAAFRSMVQWGESWLTINIKKVDGNPDNAILTSPLAHALQNIAWLGIEYDEKLEWSRPSERWYITAGQLSGRPRQFAHLKPFPGRMAQELDGNPVLVDVLTKLGMPKFDTERTSESTRLLDDLAASLDNDISEFNVFLGQVRDAWRAFAPKSFSRFPRKVVIKRGNSPLFAAVPADDNPVYLPDSSASFISALEQFSLPVIAIDTSDAKRLAQSFKDSYGDGIQLASEIEMIPLVNGEKWQRTFGISMAESELEWVIALALTLVAFSGVQAKGTNAKPFLERVQMFREATILWVPSLEAGLFKGDQKIASPSVPAIWIDKWNVLLASEDCRDDPSKLSEAISQLIKRDDLELPLKLAFKEIKDAEPGQEDIIAALAQLKIGENQFLEVREQLRGDLGQLIQMIRPILLILEPDADVGKLVELETEESVVSFLDQQGFKGFDGKRILALARSAVDRHEVGASFYKCYGEGAQLSIWNNVLIRLGESPLTNEDSQSEFTEHLTSVHTPLHALLSTTLQRNPKAGAFKELSEKLNSVQCPEHYAKEFWEISFHQVMQQVIPLFEQCQAEPAEIEALTLSETNDDLITKLKALGIRTDFDPFLVFSQNRERLQRAFQSIQKAGVCWCLRQKGIDPSPWEKNAEQMLQSLVSHLEKVGFVSRLDDSHIFNLLKLLPHDDGHVSFWQHVDTSSNIDELLGSLGITVQDLDNAQAKLDTFKEEFRKQKRLVRVCGAEFDSSEDNLSCLWSFICNQIPEKNLDGFTSIDLGSLTKLERMRIRSKRARGISKPKPRNKPKTRLTKSMEDLIGLAGEIHAFRMLQRTYGSSVVNQFTWISGYSNYVFPDKNSDDNRGCDFVIPLKKTTFCIEVKASQGDDDTFNLGSSETRLAMELAENRKRRKEIFLVLHVTDALAENPIFRLLPNPYDMRYRSLFAIEDADTRVRYKHS